MKSYDELIQIDSFPDRIRYLQTKNAVGMYTYGGLRSINQTFYHSSEWRRLRRKIILRDKGNDLAFAGMPINGRIYIHHIIPITVDDITQRTELLTDPNNLVCVSFDTHQKIHYAEDIPEPYKERTKNDTIPWR